MHVHDVLQQPHKHHPCQKYCRDEICIPVGFFFFPSSPPAGTHSSLPVMLLVFQHSLMIHRHIRATERAIKGNQALSTASRQICIQSSMLDFSLSTCHIHRCVCRCVCFRRKVHPQVRNSLGQCWDSSDDTSLLWPAYFLFQKQPGMKSLNLNSISKQYIFL